MHIYYFKDCPLMMILNYNLEILASLIAISFWRYTHLFDFLCVK